MSIGVITDTIYRVRLVPEMPVYFKAGQYLMIVMNEDDKRPFSLASPPFQKEYLELHIGASALNVHTMEVIDRFTKKKEIIVDIPYGNAWLRTQSKRPLLLIAGGTGFSYIQSILLTALEQKLDRNILVYWGVREISYLYNQNELKSLSQQYPNLHVILVVEHATHEWHGRTGMVLDAVLQDFATLTDYDIYIAGHFEMAKNACKRFCIECGAQKEHIFGDAFY